MGKCPRTTVRFQRVSPTGFRVAKTCERVGRQFEGQGISFINQLKSEMTSSRVLQQSGRQIYRILVVQRLRYHDLSRASVIGTAVEKSPEFEVTTSLSFEISRTALLVIRGRLLG